MTFEDSYAKVKEIGDSQKDGTKCPTCNGTGKVPNRKRDVHISKC
ncbi:MAG: hypothetical protein QQN46_01180 [Nitrosopumilus sp.]